MLLEFAEVQVHESGQIADSAALSEPAWWQNDAVSEIRAIRGWLDSSERAQLIAFQDQMEWGCASLRYSSPGARKSDCCRIAPNSTSWWLYHKLATTFIDMNKRYRFVLSGFNEEAQLLRYGSGGVLDWHTDLAVGPTSVRKLALVALVERSVDCGGGEFEFATVTGQHVLALPGDAVVFPPFIPHRVTCLSQGSRLSLVAWACGPAFK